MPCGSVLWTRACRHGVEQRADQPAVDRADRVVGRFVRRTSEYDAARLDLGDGELHQPADRRLREVAVDHGAQVVDAGHGEALGGARPRRVPGHGLRALRPPVGIGLGFRQFQGHRDSFSSSSLKGRYFCCRSGSSRETACTLPHSKRASRTGMSASPDCGEPILVSGGSALVGRPDDDARALQCLQPRRDPVTRCTRARHDVAEVGGTERNLPDDEQRPSLADKLEGRGDRAWSTRQFGQHHCAHDAQHARVSLKVKLTTLVLRTGHDRDGLDPFSDLDDYLALPRVAGLAVSPDGSRVVTTVAELNDKRTEYVSAVWELDPAGQRPARRLTRGAKGESSPVFTADGDLLFVAARPTDEDDKAPASLWRLPAAGGEAVEELALPGGVDGVRTARAAAVTVVAGETAAVGVRRRRRQTAANAAQGQQGVRGAAHRLSGAVLGSRPRARPPASARRRRAPRPDPATRGCAA